MFKCSVQEGWQNRNRLALGICFGQPRRAHQILFDVCGEVNPSAPMVTPNAWQDRFEVRFWKPDSLFLRCWLGNARTLCATTPDIVFEFSSLAPI